MADISVQNLTKYYGDRLILQDISFDIQQGEKAVSYTHLTLPTILRV